MAFQTILSNLIDRTVRVKLDVDFEGTVYNRKKQGKVYCIEIRKSGIYVWVNFVWKRRKKKTITENRVFFIDKIEILLPKAEQSLRTIL